MDVLYWMQERYDMVGAMEAPDEESAVSVGRRAGIAGAARTRTLRAFDAEEMGRLLAKVG